MAPHGGVSEDVLIPMSRCVVLHAALQQCVCQTLGRMVRGLSLPRRSRYATGVHGTNQPWSLGKAAFSGCIRMLNEHIHRLCASVPLRAQVVVR